MGVIIQQKFAMRLQFVQPAWPDRDHRAAAPRRSGPAVRLIYQQPQKSRTRRGVRCARETVILRWVLVNALLALLLSGPSARMSAGGLARVEFSTFCEHHPVAVNPAAPSAPLPLRFGDIANADWVMRARGLEP